MTIEAHIRQLLDTNGLSPEAATLLRAAQQAQITGEMPDQFRLLVSDEILHSSLGKCVLVRWLDSAALPGWHDVDQEGPMRIVTTGILVRYSEDCVVVVLGISTSGRCHEQNVIPRLCVTHLEQISNQVIGHK